MMVKWHKYFFWGEIGFFIWKKWVLGVSKGWILEKS